MELSKRLQAATDLLDCHKGIADIGCDHGFVSIYLIESKKASWCLAMDVNQGPLKRAGEHVIEKRLSTYIETRLSDGAKEIRFVKDEQGNEKLEVQAALLAGMGGRLMLRIIEESSDKFRVMEEFVLQPQSEIAGVRRFLRKAGYQITKENMILEDGKFYPMMKVVRKECRPDQSTDNPEVPQEKMVTAAAEETLLQELFDEYGEHLLKERNQILFLYLKKEKELYEGILKKLMQTDTIKSDLRQAEIKEKLKKINMGLEWFSDEM